MMSDPLLMSNTNNREVVESLKEHLRAKYPQYNEYQIEQLIYKFLNEYLKAQIDTEEVGNEGQSEGFPAFYS